MLAEHWAVQTGKDTVSRTSLLAHGAAFLVVGFAAGMCGRAALDLAATGAPEPRVVPRDIVVVSPASEDSPAMVLRVAAELDEAAPVHGTLAYRLETAPVPRARTLAAP